MGYRSQVKAIMPKEKFEILKKNCPKNFDYMFKEEISECGYHEQEVEINGEQAVIFGWDWIKWYDGYEDVDYVMNYIHKLIDENIPCKLVEVGEDGASEQYVSNCLYEECEDYDIIYVDCDIGIDTPKDLKSLVEEINQGAGDLEILEIGTQILKHATERLTGDLEDEKINAEYNQLNKIVAELECIIKNYV